MFYLSVAQIIELHRKIIFQSGGAKGIPDKGKIESAAAQPRMTFGGRDLYPGLAEKACALGYSLIRNHAFVDGNKRDRTRRDGSVCGASYAPRPTANTCFLRTYHIGITFYGVNS